MDKRSIVDYLIVAFCGSVSVYININFTLKGFEAIAYPAIAASLTYISFNLILKYLYSSLFFRKIFDDRVKYEGEWIETMIINKVKFHSIFSINYNYKNDNFISSGISLREDGKLNATWYANSVELYLDRREIRYTYDSNMIGGAKIYGFAQLQFFEGGDRKINDGSGFLVDINGQELNRVDFEFSKVDNKLIKELIGQKYISNRKQREQFITEYHKRSG